MICVYNLLLRRVRGSLLRRVLHSRMALATVEMVEPFCLHRWHGSAPSHRCLEIAHCWHAFAIRVIVVTIVDAVYRDASDARVSSSTNDTELVSNPNAEACVLSVKCSRRLKCSAHVVQFSLAFGEVRGRSRARQRLAWHCTASINNRATLASFWFLVFCRCS